MSLFGFRGLGASSLGFRLFLMGVGFTVGLRAWKLKN